MKILLEVPYEAKMLVSNTTNSGALLQAITECRLVKTEGYGKDKKWQYVEPDVTVSLEIVPDDFMKEIAEHDPIKKLQKEKEASDARWIDYYNKSNKFEAELVALKKDLDERGITYKKEESK